MNSTMDNSIKEQANNIIKIVSRNLQSLLDFETIEYFHKDICGSLAAGWSSNDVIRFLKQTEEFNPNLPEDVALAAMDQIVKRNDTYFGGCRKH